MDCRYLKFFYCDFSCHSRNMLAKLSNDFVNIPIHRYNIDDFEIDVLKFYKVPAAPCLILYDGKYEKARVYGDVSLSVIKMLLSME